MKTTLLLVLIAGLFCSSFFAQQEDRNSMLQREQMHNMRIEPRQHQRSKDDTSYKLRYGDREIPITTHDGQNPNEPQLDIIKKTLTQDFLVNDDTTGGKVYQYSPSITMDGRGNFVIVWQDERNGNSDIYYQRFTSGGTAIGVNQKANDDVGTGYQWYPSITMNGGGNFVIVWMDYRNGNFDIYYQRFTSGGTAIGVNQKANDDVGTAYQWYPSITMDGGGNFVIVWEDKRNGNSDIYYQQYNSSGVNQGINQKANDDVGTTYQLYPSITMDGGGNFVIVWEDNRNGNHDIYYQRYNSSGVNQGINQKVNDDAGTAWQSYPSITMDGVGNFVIVWEDERNGNSDIYYQRYNSSGVNQGINQKANDDAGTAWQSYPSITMDGVGNFVIVWGDERNGNSDIYYQRYNSSGVKIGVNQKANDDAGTAWQSYPSISMDGSGNFVIVWEDWRRGNSDIYYQRYNSSGVNQGVNQKANEDVWAEGHVSPSITMDGGGNFVIVWEDYRNGGYPNNPDIYYQRYNSEGTAIGVNQKANDDVGTRGQYIPSITMDGGGNFAIVWSDYRSGNPDIYYQRYNSEGTPIGVNQKANDDVGTAYQGYSSITMDGGGNFVNVWEDGRNGNYDIYYQRYNSSGVKIGVNQKANDDVGTAYQNSPSITMDGEGNFVIVWQDYRYGFNNPDVIGQRYLSNGTANGSNYRIVADGPNYDEILPVVAANNSKIVFSWMDNRRSKVWDIYAKIVGWDWNGVTSVSQENNLPTDFSLSQNYPNPFNPSTKIKYAISSPQYATLKVYDVLGNEVATLVDEYKPAGSYEVEFNASSGIGNLASGIGYASGVYFYQLKAGNFVETKKMMLLR